MFHYTTSTRWSNLKSLGVIGTNRRGEVYLTLNFLRFSEEARRFLALPPHNTAEIGLMVDTFGLGQPTSRLFLRRVPASGRWPGGGWETVLFQDIPLANVVEFFRLETAPSHISPWEFRFESR